MNKKRESVKERKKRKEGIEDERGRGEEEGVDKEGERKVGEEEEEVATRRKGRWSRTRGKTCGGRDDAKRLCRPTRENVRDAFSAGATRGGASRRRARPPRLTMS